MAPGRRRWRRMESRFGEIGLIVSLSVATLVAAMGSLFIGYAPLSMGDVVRGLLGDEGTVGIIMQDIRLPRMLLGLMAGASPPPTSTIFTAGLSTAITASRGCWTWGLPRS